MGGMIRNGRVFVVAGMNYGLWREHMHRVLGGGVRRRRWSVTLSATACTCASHVHTALLRRGNERYRSATPADA